jgi:DNA-binding MarR family transcriptional regulator
MIILDTTDISHMEPPTDLPSQFALMIFRLNGLLMRNGERITRELGQSSARWQVLGRAGFMTQTVAQMARDMGLARQSVQRVADLLAAEGLTEFKVNHNDQRTKLVEITPAGRTVLTAIYQRNREWSRRIQSRLDPEMFLGVMEQLERIGRILEEDI